MIRDEKQYLVTIEKLSKLRVYLMYMKNFPVVDEVIQTALIRGPVSLIEELEEECVEWQKVISLDRMVEDEREDWNEDRDISREDMKG